MVKPAQTGPQVWQLTEHCRQSTVASVVNVTRPRSERLTTTGEGQTVHARAVGQTEGTGSPAKADGTPSQRTVQPVAQGTKATAPVTSGEPSSVAGSNTTVLYAIALLWDVSRSRSITHSVSPTGQLPVSLLQVRPI